VKDGLFGKDGKDVHVLGTTPPFDRKTILLRSFRSILPLQMFTDCNFSVQGPGKSDETVLQPGGKWHDPRVVKLQELLLGMSMADESVKTFMEKEVRRLLCLCCCFNVVDSVGSEESLGASSH